MPPQKPKPWTDVYPALWWGNSAPQSMDNRYANKAVAFRDHWNYDDVSEDCLRINVFTPAPGDGRKRPVLFWIHGGGFTNGNGIEHDGYNGENFARFGDVVFCSINHRLGALGYSNLASIGGEPFAASGNVGMLDIVLALEWIRDNIASFGGDPGNVTIMGQSGGGAKVCTLSAMPGAKGLFHKAVVLSGARCGRERRRSGEARRFTCSTSPASRRRDREAAGAAVEDLLRDRHPSAAEARGRDSRRERRRQACARLQPVRGRHDPAAASVSAGAGAHGRGRPDDHLLDGERAVARLDRRDVLNVSLDADRRAPQGSRRLWRGFGDRAEGVVAAYAKAFPDSKPVEIWSLVTSNRQNAVGLADAKASQPAPVFVSWFAWQPPLFDGRIGAFHCADICFWFHNTDLM